ncbi:MAG: hypothetical protein ACC662_11445, partial [Planctomycetota bacterium]
LLVGPAPARAGDAADPAAGAGDEAARAYAREQLFAQARRAAGKGAIREEDLRAMRQALADDIRFLDAYRPRGDEERRLVEAMWTTIEERILLLGKPLESAGKEDEGPALGGAAMDAWYLLRWLRGEEPCALSITRLARGEPVGEPVTYRYPPPPEPEPEAETPPEPALEGAAAEEGKEPEKGARVEVDEAGAKGEAPAKGEGVGAASPQAPAAKPAPAANEAKPKPAPISVEDWARDVVLAGEGTLLGRRIESAACGTVDDLLALARRPAKPAVDVGAGELRRHVLLTDEPFAYNRPYVAVRELQAAQQNAAMGAERPSVGLVDESTVRDKAKRAARLRARAQALEQRKQDLLDRLDRMTLDLDAWKAQAALLSGLIEEEKRKEAPPADDGAAGPREADKAPAEVVAPSDLTLRLREAQEATVSLDIRLFFQTVVRAQIRLDLLGQLIAIAEAEARGAEGTRDEFARALEQLRHERQLDRLRADERLIERWLTRARARKPEPGTPEADRVRAFEAVLAVNRLTQEAVEKRRRLSGAGLEAAEAQEPAPAGEAEAKEAT